ncbi:MAG: phosphomannomutase/phosphoglucomutase [Rickettsiales bacterium]|nr:phosphomannomutase/phosphoglucomutase [Rickettsiales bacterium]
MHNFHSSILRAGDIRGIYNETLFDADALAIGKAFATCIIRETGKANPIINVAYDGRLSTPALSGALKEGIISTGATVHDYGIGPTPLMYFSVYHSNPDAGIMVTGSHNPGNHNGFKMMIGKDSFFGEHIETLGKYANTADYEIGQGAVINKDCKDEYLETLAAAFKPKGARNIKVVVDPGNGAAGEISERLAAMLSADITVINAEIDGNFPNHHPDPTIPALMQQLIETVQAQDADVGIAYDGDGDRIGAVDKTGRILYGDQLMVLFGRDVLLKHPGATIIADVKASQTLFDDIAQHGGQPLMWKTGHSFVKAKMKETKAHLAGEMSGHIFFADEYFGYDDGIYSGVRLINLLAHSDKPLEQLMDEMPEVYNTPEIRIETTETLKFSAVAEIKERLAAAGADVDDVDGVRVKNADGWWLARASNTQAAIIARAEGNSPEALERLKTLLASQLSESGIMDFDLG